MGTPLAAGSLTAWLGGLLRAALPHLSSHRSGPLCRAFPVHQPPGIRPLPGPACSLLRLPLDLGTCHPACGSPSLSLASACGSCHSWPVSVQSPTHSVCSSLGTHFSPWPLLFFLYFEGNSDSGFLSDLTQTTFSHTSPSASRKPTDLASRVTLTDPRSHLSPMRPCHPYLVTPPASREPLPPQSDSSECEGPVRPGSEVSPGFLLCSGKKSRLFVGPVKTPSSGRCELLLYLSPHLLEPCSASSLSLLAQGAPAPWLCPAHCPHGSPPPRLTTLG